MRQKKLVKTGTAFLLSILVSVLVVLVNGANIKSVALDDQDTTIVQIVQLSNVLENQYEEINTALRFQVNGVEQIDTKSIEDLVKNQDDLIAEWETFKSDFCQQDTNNCIDNKEDLAQRINDNLQDLEKIRPLFVNQEQIILTLAQYKGYISYLKELDNYNKEQEVKKTQGDSSAATQQPPVNPITSNPEVVSIQNFIKEELEKIKTDKNSAQIDNIIPGIESESGLFFRQTQAGVTIFSTEKSRSIEDDLLKINERFLTVKNNTENIYPNNIQNIFIAIIGLFTLIIITVLVILYRQNPELFRNNRIIKSLEHKYRASQGGSKTNLNADDSINQISILIEDFKQYQKELQKQHFEKLRVLEYNNIEAYKEVSRNNNKVLKNVSKLLENTAQKLTNNNLLAGNTKDKSRQSTIIKKKEDSQIYRDQVEEKVSNLNKTQSILSTLINSDKLEDLVNNYNQKTINRSNIVKVSATRESIEKRRTGDNTPLILTQGDEGNEATWVVTKYRLQDNCYFLVPKSGLIINDRIYQTIEDIFMCKGYKNRASNEFKLMLPAIARSRSNNKWELVEPGELIFEEKDMF